MTSTLTKTLSTKRLIDKKDTFWREHNELSRH